MAWARRPSVRTGINSVQLARYKSGFWRPNLTLRNAAKIADVLYAAGWRIFGQGWKLRAAQTRRAVAADAGVPCSLRPGGRHADNELCGCGCKNFDQRGGDCPRCGMAEPAEAPPSTAGASRALVAVLLVVVAAIVAGVAWYQLASAQHDVDQAQHDASRLKKDVQRQMYGK